MRLAKSGCVLAISMQSWITQHGIGGLKLTSPILEQVPFAAQPQDMMVFILAILSVDNSNAFHRRLYVFRRMI